MIRAGAGDVPASASVAVPVPVPEAVVAARRLAPRAAPARAESAPAAPATGLRAPQLHPFPRCPAFARSFPCERWSPRS